MEERGGALVVKSRGPLPGRAGVACGYLGSPPFTAVAQRQWVGWVDVMEAVVVDCCVVSGVLC